MQCSHYGTCDIMLNMLNMLNTLLIVTVMLYLANTNTPCLLWYLSLCVFVQFVQRQNYFCQLFCDTLRSGRSLVWSIGHVTVHSALLYLCLTFTLLHFHSASLSLCFTFTLLHFHSASLSLYLTFTLLHFHSGSLSLCFTFSMLQSSYLMLCTLLSYFSL